MPISTTCLFRVNSLSPFLWPPFLHLTSLYIFWPPFLPLTSYLPLTSLHSFDLPLFFWPPFLPLTPFHHLTSLSSFDLPFFLWPPFIPLTSLFSFELPFILWTPFHPLNSLSSFELPFILWTPFHHLTSLSSLDLHFSLWPPSSTSNARLQSCPTDPLNTWSCLCTSYTNKLCNPLKRQLNCASPWVPALLGIHTVVTIHVYDCVLAFIELTFFVMFRGIVRRTHTTVLTPVLFSKLRVAIFASALWQLYI